MTKQTNGSIGQKIAVIGSGLAGLAAAYDLGRAGKAVTVLEAASVVGGLASSLDILGHRIERFYHFICRGDDELMKLVDELGLGEDAIDWQRSQTHFFYQGSLYGFGSPFDLLRFEPVPFFQRIRFGLNVVLSTYRYNWEKLDGLSAYDWLRQQVGDKAYEVIWDPLLRVKFGDYHKDISAAWMWHRIHRVARSRRVIWEPEMLGTLEQGTESVIRGLLEKLEAMPNVSLRTSAPVERILHDEGHVRAIQVAGDEAPIEVDGVVSTIALNLLARMLPDVQDAYFESIREIDYIGVVCGLMRLKQPLTHSFWVNINDPDIEYNGVIEYTNLNTRLRDKLNGQSIVYTPIYVRTAAPIYSYDDETLYRIFVNGFTKLNPAFDESWIEEWHISRAPYAQAICNVGFKDKVPSHQTPLAGLYATDSTQYYPEDRTISAAIRLGRRVARMMLES